MMWDLEYSEILQRQFLYFVDALLSIEKAVARVENRKRMLVAGSPIDAMPNASVGFDDLTTFMNAMKEQRYLVAGLRSFSKGPVIELLGFFDCDFIAVEQGIAQFGNSIFEIRVELACQMLIVIRPEFPNDLPMHFDAEHTAGWKDSAFRSCV